MVSREDFTQKKCGRYFFLTGLLVAGLFLFQPFISRASDDAVGPSDAPVSNLTESSPETPPNTPSDVVEPDSTSAAEVMPISDIAATAETIPSAADTTSIEDVSTTVEEAASSDKVITPEASSTEEASPVQDAVSDQVATSSDEVTTPDIVPTPEATPAPIVNSGSVSGSAPVVSTTLDASSTSTVVVAPDVATTTEPSAATSTQEVTSVAALTPMVDEQFTDNGKTVIVSVPDGMDESLFIDVQVRTAIPEVFKVGQESQIKITWKNNDDQVMQLSLIHI